MTKCSSRCSRFYHYWRQLWSAMVVCLSLVACTYTGTVSLSNNTQETISRATLHTSWGEEIEVTKLAPKEMSTLNYRVREGDYKVEVVFQSGRRFTSDTAYVTPGFNYRDRITVTESGIRLTHTPMASR